MSESKYSELPLTDNVPSTNYEDIVLVDGEKEAINNTVDHVQTSEEHDTAELVSARRMGAGLFCALFGCLIGGPILALITGGFAAYASSKDGATGDAVRALGDVALTARDKAIEVNEKHDIMEKTKAASRELCERTRAASREFCFRRNSDDAGTNLII